MHQMDMEDTLAKGIKVNSYEKTHSQMHQNDNAALKA